MAMPSFESNTAMMLPSSAPSVSILEATMTSSAAIVVEAAGGRKARATLATRTFRTFIAIRIAHRLP